MKRGKGPKRGGTQKKKKKKKKASRQKHTRHTGVDDNNCVNMRATLSPSMLLPSPFIGERKTNGDSLRRNDTRVFWGLVDLSFGFVPPSFVLHFLFLLFTSHLGCVPCRGEVRPCAAALGR